MTSPQPEKSVTGRVLSILALFENGPRAQSLSDISAGTGLPLSTAHRLVNELVEWGFLGKNTTGRYQLGLRLWSLAQNAGRQIRETASPFIRELHQLTGETSHIAIRDGNKALYIERIYSDKRVARVAKAGGKLPLHAVAVGKILLAFEEPWVRDAYLKLPLERFTPHTKTNPQQLAAELDKIKEQGFAVAHEELSIGTTSIAVPVWHTGKIGAGLGIVLYASQTKDLHRHLPTLKAMSAKIERATANIPLETLRTAHITPELHPD